MLLFPACMYARCMPLLHSIMRFTLCGMVGHTLGQGGKVLAAVSSATRGNAANAKLPHELTM